MKKDKIVTAKVNIVPDNDLEQQSRASGGPARRISLEGGGPNKTIGQSTEGTNRCAGKLMPASCIRIPASFDLGKPQIGKTRWLRELGDRRR